MFDIRSHIISRRGAPSEILPPRSCGNQITVRCRDPRGQCQNVSGRTAPSGWGKPPGNGQRPEARDRNRRAGRWFNQAGRGTVAQLGRQDCRRSLVGNAARRAAEAVDFAKAARLRSTDQPDPVRSGESGRISGMRFTRVPRGSRGAGVVTQFECNRSASPAREDRPAILMAGGILPLKAVCWIGGISPVQIVN